MVGSPRYVELESRLDFSRLVCALEAAPRISFLHEHMGRMVMSAHLDVLVDRPVVYYTPVEQTGRYLSYGIRGGREEAGIVDSISDRSKMYSPLIRIKSLPESLRPGKGDDDRYMRLELEDLDSLAKLSYGAENSLPLFLFPEGNGWYLGAFMNFGEDDDDAYFCYVSLGEDPKKPFLKHSANNGAEPSFVDSPADHGYSYVKIIRLRDAHPLIEHVKLQN